MEPFNSLEELKSFEVFDLSMKSESSFIIIDSR